MPMDRRSLLKAMACTPVLSLLSFPRQSLLADYTDGYVAIRFVGLFFMEFQKNHLIVATPQYKHHEFCIFDKNGKCCPMPEIVVPDDLATGQRSSFEDENLQFPASLLSDGFVVNYQTPGQHKHRCTMILPRPEKICVDELNDASKFRPKKGGKIGEQILANVKPTTGGKPPKLAASTILLYKPINVPAYSVTYFAAHRGYPTVHGVNCALKAARHVCGSRFDLQMECIPPQSAMKQDAKDRANTRQATVVPEEFGKSDLNVDIASCPQFAIGH
jgi:hypothetical protein